jgi:23S rRNA (cytidine1920-2'-O)/16S rRNA (cytidine1409-2'-O)-methyltransferase
LKPKSPKPRLDQLLVDRGLAENRTRAQALVMAGLVMSETRRLDKPGHRVDMNIPLTVKGPDHPWVSRGGVKLAHGLEHFNISLEGCIALDVGASTGGFSDVLLNGGAIKVYCVDVGHGQLAWKISQDPRVVVLDKTNARNLTAEQVPELVNLIVCDASFIGLEVILPAPMALAAPASHLIALIKPQFEVGKGNVGKGGVVRNEALHRDVIERIDGWIKAQANWRVLGVSESPLTGADGNKEFLIVAVKEDDGEIK